MAASITWLAEPEEHDYAAAASYLLLLLGAHEVGPVIAALRAAPNVQHPAKDLMRASGLGVLPADDVEVARDLKKVKKGKGISPVLLVRGRLGNGIGLTVADGFHRICATYHVDEDAQVIGRIADLRVGNTRASRA